MELINTIATSWWSWMSSMFWQVSLLILIITLLDIVLRNWAWPQIRYALWLLILLKLMIPPTWSLNTSIVSHIQPKVHQRFTQNISLSSQQPLNNAARELESKDTSAVPADSLNTAQTVPAQQSDESLSWQSILMLIWFGGVLLLSSLLAIRIARLRRWHKQQKEHDIPEWFHKLLVETAQHFQLTNLPAIVFHPKAVSPAVYGMFRPVMLLPSCYFDNLSKEQAKHVLLHELAHLKRGDLWMNGLVLIMQIIYWFNPLIIWVRRQMKHVREICCDLTVANVLRDKTPAYRQTLLNTARGLLTETVEPGLGLLGVFEDPFRLVTRLKWLDKAHWGQQKKIATAAILLTLLITVSVMPMAGVSIKKSGMSSSEDIFDESFRVLIRPDFYAVFLSKTGDAHQGVPAAIQECRKLMQDQGIRPLGDPMARFFNDPATTPADRQQWQVGFRVNKAINVAPPLELVHLGRSQVAISGVAGQEDTTQDWDAFIKRIQANGLVPYFPPAIEYYRGEKYEKPMRHYTQMEIAVFHLSEGSSLDIQLKKTGPFTAVVLPMSGSYMQTSEALHKVEQFIKKHNMKMSGNAFGEFYWSDSLPLNANWIVGYPVTQPADVAPPFEIRKFQSKTVATATLTDAPDIETPWSLFLTQLVLSGHVPAGPAFEYWATPFAQTTDITMQIPVLNEDMIEDASTTSNSEPAPAPDSWAQVIVDMVEAVTHYQGTKNQDAAPVSASIRAKLEYSNQMLKKALLARDVDAYVNFLTEDMVIDPPMGPAIRGKQAYRRYMQKDIQNGTEFKTFNPVIVDCWQCDDEIFEVGQFDFSLTTPASSKPHVGTGSSMTIWQQADDGTLKIKYSIFNHTVN